MVTCSPEAAISEIRLLAALLPLLGKLVSNSASAMSLECFLTGLQEHPLLPSLGGERPLSPSLDGEHPLLLSLDWKHPLSPSLDGEHRLSPNLDGEHPLSPNLVGEHPLSPSLGGRCTALCPMD